MIRRPAEPATLADALRRGVDRALTVTAVAALALTVSPRLPPLHTDTPPPFTHTANR